MGDRAKEAAARAGVPPVPRISVVAAAPLALFSMTTGMLAVGLGALAALLVPGSPARALVWMVVTILVAACAGFWWGFTPVTDRLRVLGRILPAVLPPDSRGR
ncbi:hypothetical protein OK074_4559 [Actinobacteria bacterium OK074]|nr:hypothetical protein OK074_4559 [Actinobacteria bacterium OK074]